jgi:hypothetical protein
MQRRNRIRETATDILLEVKKVAVNPPKGERKGPKETYHYLRSLKRFKGREREIGSDKRVARLINDLLEKHSPKDSPFEWHRMEEWGIPWQASDFILQMLNEEYEKKKGIIESRESALESEWWAKYQPGWWPEIHDYTATFRQVIWWWRVHQAAPEIPQHVGELTDIRDLGDSFAVRELVSELLDSPSEAADLEACLALKPWLDEERHSNYHEMVELGVAPPIKLEFMDMTSPTRRGLLSQVRGRIPLELVGRLRSQAMLKPEHPELLSSQQWAIQLAAWSDGRLSYSLDTGLQDSTG